MYIYIYLYIYIHYKTRRIVLSAHLCFIASFSKQCKTIRIAAR